MREICNINKGWLFQKPGESEVIVDVPHCCNAVDGQDGSAMFRGIVSYKKKWTLDEKDAGRSHYLEVGAAELASQVKINGILAHESKVGFSLYRVPMDSLIHVGENEIEILVNNEINNNIYPAMADFSFYNGLYRDVNVISDDAVHFAETDGSRDGIVLLPEIVTGSDETGILTVNASVTAETTSICGAFEVKAVVKMADGTVAAEVSQPLIITDAGDTEVTLHLEIADLHRWDGLADPYLYTAEISISDAAGNLCDQRTLPIGFRTICYDKEQGFLLNEKPLKLHGVAKHQDFGGVGNAITTEHMQRDLELILDMGANAVRCSHYQHCDEWYEMCDRAGLLVWAEVPVISCVPQKEEADINAKEHLTYLIPQVRNHTSVFCWGVQNEVCMISKNSYTFRLVDELAKQAKAADPTRMVAQANENSTEDNCPIMQSTDILGFNLYYGWYYGEIPDLQPRLDSIHAANPDKPMILTEYGVDTNPSFHSLDPKVKDYSEEYQLLFQENAINAIEERTFMAGGFAWNMFDFGSAGRDEGGKKGQNQKGLVTIDRKLCKDVYYLYKAHWSKNPFVYIAGRRFVNRPQEKTTITVMTNMNAGQTVSLTVNGNFVASKAVSSAMTLFEEVALNPGENTIAVSTIVDGQTCTDQITINRVEESDPSYVCPKNDEGGKAVNWFEGLDPETMARVEEKPLRPEGFTFEDILPDIFDNEKAAAVFMKYLSPLTDNPRFSSKAPFSVNRLLGWNASLGIPEAILKACEQELNAIDK